METELRIEHTGNLQRKSASSFQRILAGMVSVTLMLCAVVASAADVSLPAVNLGDTSFVDGVAYPGWFVEETLGYYHADRFKDPQGNRVAGSNKLTAVSATTHIVYLSKYRLMGGFWGTEVLLPLADVDVETSFGPKDRERGVGNLIVSPFILQWTDQKLFAMPYFQRVVVAVTVPTGSYDRSRPVNAGSDMVSINPYYAFTILPTEKFEVSARLHYLWNSENDRPFVGMGAGTIQPGQAFHANYAASYEVVKGVRLGLSGYALQQLTADKIDGRSQANSEERVFGIGPGIMLTGNVVSLCLNSYFETGAENRPEGTKVVLRFFRVF